VQVGHIAVGRSLKPWQLLWREPSGFRRVFDGLDYACRVAREQFFWNFTELRNIALRRFEHGLRFLWKFGALFLSGGYRRVGMAGDATHSPLGGPEIR